MYEELARRWERRRRPGIWLWSTRRARSPYPAGRCELCGRTLVSCADCGGDWRGTGCGTCAEGKTCRDHEKFWRAP